jgi:hypothetical protein
MKHTLFCIAAGASACASLSPIPTLSSGSHVHVACLPHLGEPARTFPARLDEPALPSADALAGWWRMHDHLTAKVELCVAPSGKTMHVRLLGSSGEEKYDEAVVYDVARWRYEPFTSEASSPVCEPATVTYLL